jgi:hypothetical protein
MKNVTLSCVAALAALATLDSGAADLPSGYWPVDLSQPILDKTRTIRLAPDLSELTDGEREAVRQLLEAGALLQHIYEDSRHPEARESLARLEALHASTGAGPATGNLLDLYRLNQGPIATTLDNRREAFLPVAPEAPTRNVYPAGATREEIDAFLATHPQQRDAILGERTVVRRGTRDDAARDLAVLRKYPVLDTLHPGLAARLRAVAEEPARHAFYAVPQSVAWADELMAVYEHLNRAADALESDDAEFARYLRNRSRDLLSDDYESGDAAWVTGRFNRLNLQIGSYETYDDALYGVKAFMSLSLLIRDAEASRRLTAGLASLQAVEDALPYQGKKRVRENIPVGAYQVIADFGQARGANTATILPNDELFSRRYGRTILLRENIMRDPILFTNTKAGWDAVMTPAQRDDLRPDGNFNRTLWHEIGHYLGVDRDATGRPLDEALESTADSFEEMKADLVSLFAAERLRTAGYYDDASLRSVYASGILRTLQSVKPRREQPYQTMQLMQFNWFLEHGLITFDPQAGLLSIHYDRYPDVVTSLLREVLAIQHAGDRTRAEAFMQRWTAWTPDVHEVIAGKRRASLGFRYVIVTYAATDGRG